MKPERVTPSIAAALLLAGPVAWAQDAIQGAVKQSVTISTHVSVNETFTNNVGLSNAAAKSEQITEISPGMHINVDGARLKTYFDYSLTHVDYAQGTSASRNQNALNTFGTLEAVDNWAFLDFSGNISQQTISAFGTQSTNNTAINANRTEVASYNLSPYVKGHLGDVANYEARISRAVSSSDNAAASNTATTNSVVKVSNASTFRSLGWTADLSRQEASYSAGRTTEADIYSLGLTYEITPQVKVSANAGQESNNYTSLDKQNYNTHSLGLNWSPSELTTLSALTGKRSFGNTHNVSFEHRSSRTVWRFSDSRDVSVNPNQGGSGRSAYEQANSLFAAISDPVLRERLVQAYLQQSNPTAVNGFLTSAVSVQRSQNLSVALLGIRDTVTFLLTRTESNRLDTVTTALDNLSNGATVIQSGFSFNYSHRLTPDYSLSALLSRQNTSGNTNTEETTLKSFNVYLSGKVGNKTAASLGLRHVVSDSATNPYTENAVIGNLNVQF
jgi:uncharacterized protein (PEP-CTERM system associated)